ncbi:hypothetical protein D3C87_2057030 [compost metagenome]
MSELRDVISWLRVSTTAITSGFAALRLCMSGYTVTEPNCRCREALTQSTAMSGLEVAT